MNRAKTFKTASAKITNQPYKKVNSIEELLTMVSLDHVDLSDLDLRNYAHAFTGELPDMFNPWEEAKKHKVIKSWTTNVIWPPRDKMPNDFDPQKILNDGKHPTEMDTLHTQGITGKNIGIAIIDTRLNDTHPEYANKIKHYEIIDGHWEWDISPYDYHGSLVVGCAVGEKTGTAPGADLYYIAALSSEKEGDKKSVPSRKYTIEAIKKILEINKTLPENKKIRFVSRSAHAQNDLLHKECEKLYDECEKNGIMILGGTYKHTNSSKTACDKRYPNKYEERIGIPTNGKTTPFYQGGYYYTRDGGPSSTFPYLAGVFACALQGNTIFCTRDKWQDELIEIMKQTARDHEHGGKIINPVGIRNRVTEIAREMKKIIMKTNGTQHE